MRGGSSLPQRPAGNARTGEGKSGGGSAGGRFAGPWGICGARPVANLRERDGPGPPRTNLRGRCAGETLAWCSLCAAGSKGLKRHFSFPFMDLSNERVELPSLLTGYSR
ncbi:mitochondrial import inner membrane translocase subunit Tim9 isoform X1 [Taeniopygia guttata]|uniref:mitochondrial import inner membrane translocase subunit Tim9 isoform X1 n=1 Tax=Taeniopygia guttata TaxID=59729 RepID=UPI003BB8E24C